MFCTTRVLVTAALVALAAATGAEAQSAAVWNVTFPTSEVGPAQQHFVEGVTSMHLHMFEDALGHFHAAQRLAPDFAMAYWGEALNQHRTIWRIHDLDAARRALLRLGATPAARAAKAPTAREKAYLAAVETLFGAGTRPEREAAYSEAMRITRAGSSRRQLTRCTMRPNAGPLCTASKPSCTW